MNRDLWEALDQPNAEHTVLWQRVKGQPDMSRTSAETA